MIEQTSLLIRKKAEEVAEGNLSKRCQKWARDTIIIIGFDNLSIPGALDPHFKLYQESSRRQIGHDFTLARLEYQLWTPWEVDMGPAPAGLNDLRDAFG